MSSTDEVQTPVRVVMSIPEFCARYDVSRTFYYTMREQGIGPRELRLSPRRVVILESAAKEWERDVQRLKGNVVGGNGNANANDDDDENRHCNP